MAKHIQPIIRTMNFGDVTSVGAIEKLSFPCPWTERSFKHELENDYSINYVVLHVDVIIGYLCAQEILDEAQILKLAVLTEFRRCGVGTALLNTLFAALKQHNFSGKIFLEARVSNTAAIEFYKKHNFRPIHIRKDYYDNPVEDAMVMMLDTLTQVINF
ncbi:ribosomal protein S18-alanine N-acetyltransferase [Candidatus Magnetomonas plexicatena]|uniref:ribosomal protein S18-alanine N-acetyltransferase n=1 Tax=Candidatus Magnetomonas plexicatena TaxID=2552947 RepID=UPI001C78F6E4|nr:ribosomal protein S18-alanine N-acetyltransferase [Nitrospirales bacterium LBB_01]